MKKQIFKESFLATATILVTTYLISFIPWSLEYAKALHQGFADFDIYDLYYSGKNRYNSDRDTNIILVKVGANRTEIARQIFIIEKYDPKVLGLDLIFEQNNPDPFDISGDSMLSSALKNRSNIVFAYRMINGRQPVHNFFFSSFDPNRTGYVNWDGDAYSVIRSYTPKIRIDSFSYQAFTSAIVQCFDRVKYQSLMKRKNLPQLINYSGNIENYLSLNPETLSELDTTGQLPMLVSGKIVILGNYVNPHDFMPSPLVLDDLHFTPLNEKVSGKSYPDMYGAVIHANILSMILEKNYATLASLSFSYFCAFLITFFFCYFVISRFYKKTHPNHAFFLLIQVLVILFVLYIFLEIFHWFLFKIRLEPVMVSLVLCLEMLGLYKSIALWMHRKLHYQTIFNPKKII